MGSALPSLAIPNIVEDFGITSQAGKVLPISVYLIGYVFGPLVWGPLSEHLGRRRLSLAAFALFCAFTLACGLAPNDIVLIAARALQGVGGALLTPGSLALIVGGMILSQFIQGFGVLLAIMGLMSLVGGVLKRLQGR